LDPLIIDGLLLLYLKKKWMIPVGIIVKIIKNLMNYETLINGELYPKYEANLSEVSYMKNKLPTTMPICCHILWSIEDN
jgi:hypothetical protein